MLLEHFIGEKGVKNDVEQEEFVCRMNRQGRHQECKGCNRLYNCFKGRTDRTWKIRGDKKKLKPEQRESVASVTLNVNIY